MKKYPALILLLVAGFLGLVVFWATREPVPLKMPPPSPAVVSPTPLPKKESTGAPGASSPTSEQVFASGSRAPKNAGGDPGRLARQRAMLNRPELREVITRGIAKDYRPLFDKLRLTSAKEELLSKILLDRMTSSERDEWDDYEKLAAQLLTESEYSEFKEFRNELVLKASAASAVASVKAAGGDATAEHETMIAAVVRDAPCNGDQLWAEADIRERAGTLTLADLYGLEAVASQRFEAALNQHAAGLTEAERRALRGWFQKSVIDSHIGGMRKRLTPDGG
jgi:hypothetical protein